MIPGELFIDSPQLQDVSMHSLSEVSESWPEEITQKLKEKIPSSDGMSLIVKIMKKDEENGTATGSIQIANNKTQVVVPLIIKDFMMYPLDVFLAKNKLLPLTEDYFNSVFKDNEVFQKLDEYPMYAGIGRFDNGNLWEANYPPGLGRYSYASAGYPILDIISETIDASEMKQYLISNPGVAVNFEKNGHAEIIKKLANLQPVNMGEYRQGVDKLINKNIFMLRKQGPNAYSILSNNDSTFSPTLEDPIDRESFRKRVIEISESAHDDINDVDCNGEKLLVAPGTGTVSPYLAGVEDNEIGPANEFGHYIVKNRNGVDLQGLVIPTVIDFNMTTLPITMFISKDHWGAQSNIAGIRKDDSSFKLEGQVPRVGQTGVFVYQPNEKKALSTIPVTIRSVSQTEDSRRLDLKVKDFNGLDLFIEIDSGTHPLQRIAKIGSGYRIPSDKFSWVPLGTHCQITSNPIDHMAKAASKKLTDNPVTLIPTGYDQYAMKGVSKYAHSMGWDATNLDRWKAEFLLASIGMDNKSMPGLFKGASIKGFVAIHGLNRPKLASEKIAAAIPVAESVLGFTNKVKCNLLKEASFMDNSQTVDALLSLKFVNPDNIQKFVAKMPSLKSAISHLASLLIASRLGVQEIPEHAASSAMYRLVEVVNSLESLRATQEG